MESPPVIAEDPVTMADVEAICALANEVEGVRITHMVLSPMMEAIVKVADAYAPLPFRRPPSKRADRRLRGRMIEAMRRANP